MCELLAYSAKSEYPLNKVLRSFYKRSKYNPHGWGQAILNNNGLIIEKEPVNALRSLKLFKLLQHPINAKLAIAHIRYATTGDMKIENTHPFKGTDNSGRVWVLVHNGTVIVDEALQKYQSLQKGDTDSERILLYLLDQINQELEKNKGQLNSKQRFQIVDKLVHELSGDNNKLNLIIDDQEQIYLHTNGYGQMFQTKLGDGILFSTRDFDLGEEQENEWYSVPRMKTLCYRDGELVFSGSSHGNEYIPDPEIEKELISRYAHLS